MNGKMAKPLTKKTFHEALVYLKDRDGDLASILLTIGPPPMRHHEPGFSFLVHIHLEQQVSLAAAKAAFDRLVQALPALTPRAFLKIDSDTLQQIGFSRQKTQVLPQRCRCN